MTAGFEGFSPAVRVRLGQMAVAACPTEFERLLAAALSVADPVDLALIEETARQTRKAIVPGGVS